MVVYKNLAVLIVNILFAALPVFGQQCTLSVSLTSSDNGAICTGNNVVLTAKASAGTAPYTYLWSTGETTPAINVNKAGTYNVIVTDKTAGCQPVTKRIVVTEAPTPGAPGATGATVCRNETATLKATGPGGTFQWYDAPTGGKFLASGAVYVTPPIGTRTLFYVENTLNGCTGPRTAVTVNISGNPRVTGTTICAGTQATLYATGGSNYIWYDAPGGKVLTNGPAYTTPPLNRTTTYYVVAVINGCTSTATPVTATVVSFPQGPKAPDVTICNGETANLHAAAAGTIDWYDVPKGGTSLISSPDFTTPVLTASKTYYVQNSSNGCESPRTAVRVTVNPIPVAPVVQPVTICPGTTAVLKAPVVAGVTYNWYADAGGTNLLITKNTYTTPVLTRTTTYYVQTVKGGCTSSLTTVTVTVTARPNQPAVNVTPVCKGSPSTLAVAGPAADAVYQWYDAATGGTLLVTGTTYTTPPLSANKDYYVQTVSNGCISNRVKVTATILPAVTPPAAGNAAVCTGSAATLTASGADNYQWYNKATGGTLLSNERVFTTPALSATTTFYVQTIKGCASARTPVMVTVNRIPPKPVANGTNTCPGDPVTLNASVPAGGTITWYDAATGGAKLKTGPSFTTPALNETTTYYVQNTEGDCVSGRTAVTVSITAIISPQFKYATSTFCKTSPNVLPIIYDPNGTFSVNSPNLVFADNKGTIDIAASAPGSYVVTFTGTGPCQNKTTATITITETFNAGFKYVGGPFCQYAATNPSAMFDQGASAGTFSASPNLVLIGTQIDLQKSIPGTYTITNTIPASGGCEEKIATTQVTISPGVKISAGQNQAVNAGEKVQLAGSVIFNDKASSGIWKTSGKGTFSDPSAANATYTPAPNETTATLTFTSTASAGSCGPKSDNMVVTIVPAPAAPTAKGTTVCAGDRARLSATAPGGSYAWYDAPTGGNQVGSGTNFTTPALTAITTYYVQTTIAGNTSSRTAVKVVVNDLPKAPDAAAVSTCYDTPATLSVQNPTGKYEWYDVPNGGEVKGNGATFTSPALTSNTFYYVQAVSSAGCPSPRTKVAVTLTQPPVITSAAEATICSQNTLNYTITSDIPATYTWSRPAVPGIEGKALSSQPGVINETLINTSTKSVKVTYQITATANNCTSNFQYEVMVLPLPILDPISVSKATVCNNSPINYTIKFNDPNAVFSWSREEVSGISNSPVSGQAAATIREVLHNQTDALIDVPYMITYSKGNCSATFKFVITVAPTFMVTSPQSADVCNDTPLGYQIVSDIPAVTYKWSRDVVAGISNDGVIDQTAPVINERLVNTTTNTINVVYLITPVYGCEGRAFPLVVSVFPTTPTPVVNSNSPVCVASSINLRTPAIRGAVYAWTGPNGFTSDKQNPVINNATAANSGTYSLRLTLNDCQGKPATTIVGVNNPASVNAGPDTTVCLTVNAINLSGSVTGGTTTGTWTTNGTGLFLPSAGELNARYIPSQADKNMGGVLLTLASTSKDNCTIATANTKITFGATPAVDAGTDLEACTTSPLVSLDGKLLKQYTGSVIWKTAGTGTFTPSAAQLDASYEPSANDISNGSVRLTLTYVNAGVCDIPTDDVVLRFVPPPTVNAGGTKYVLQGRTITLTPTVSDENVRYIWAPNEDISDNGVKNPVVTGNIDRVYTLTVIDSRGCENMDRVYVKVTPEIKTTNTFTPNGDGINDYWSVTGLVAYAEAVVDIFNRNGSKIYHSIGYDKPWDGTFNGKPLPVGTYYYVIRLNVNGQVLSGPVTILR